MKTIVVGITGGLGSGKSTLAKYFEEKSHKVIYTDDLAKEVLINDPEIKDKLKKSFGNEIISESGDIDRKILAGIVFGNSESRKKNLDTLNKIVHPVVIEKMIALTEKYEKSGEEMIFIESALIFEAGLDEGFDYIIVVTADDDIRIERSMQRLGISQEEAIQRIAEQLPQEEIASAADFVIENNQGLTSLEKSIDLVYLMLQGVN